MTKSQELQIRMSEIRQRLNELLGVESRTAEQQTELETLTTEAARREPELRAALAAEPDPEVRTTATDGADAETRERVNLARGARVGAWIESAISGKPIEGRERELSDAYGCHGMLPLIAFEVERPLATETRAVTPGVTAVQAAAPTVPYAFERSAAASLRFTFPTVPAGQANYPVVSTGAPAGAVGKGDAALVTAGAFRLDRLDNGGRDRGTGSRGRMVGARARDGRRDTRGAAPGRRNAGSSRRHRPAPPDALSTIRDCVERSIYAATGIPAALVSDRGDGTAGREALRRMVATTLGPVGRIIAAELARKLDPAAALGFGSIAAADITGRARAWRTLVGRDGDMDTARAAELTGLS